MTGQTGDCQGRSTQKKKSGKGKAELTGEKRIGKNGFKFQPRELKRGEEGGEVVGGGRGKRPDRNNKLKFQGGLDALKMVSAGEGKGSLLAEEVTLENSTKKTPQKKAARIGKKLPNSDAERVPQKKNLRTKKGGQSKENRLSNTSDWTPE